MTTLVFLLKAEHPSEEFGAENGGLGTKGIDQSEWGPRRGADTQEERPVGVLEGVLMFNPRRQKNQGDGEAVFQQEEKQ